MRRIHPKFLTVGIGIGIRAGEDEQAPTENAITYEGDTLTYEGETITYTESE